MKDTFGGTIMIYILIFFLGIYIVFIALTLQYAQSFNVKNKIINLIEDNNGYNNNVKLGIEDYLSRTNISPNKIEIDIVNNGDLKKTCYYVVKSKINWNWAFFDISGTWVIKGETKNVTICPEKDGQLLLELDL